MKEADTSNINHVSRKPLQCIAATTPVTLSKSRFEFIAMPMICSLMEHGFLSVCSMVGKIMLYSNEI